MRPHQSPIVIVAALLLGGAAFSVKADSRDRDLCASGSDAALAACTRIIAAQTESVPDRATALFHRAALQARAGNAERAIADYDAAIRLKPDFAAAYNERGTQLAMKQEHRRAIADFDVAIRLDPTNAQAFFNRASEQGLVDEDARAMADFDTAIKLDEKFALAYVGRGNLWAKKNEPRKAIADYDVALRLDPRNIAALINRGNQWDLERDPKRAVADFDAAIAIDPGFVQAHNGKAWTLLRAGRPGEALIFADQAVKLDPNAAYALDTRARINEALGQLERAFADTSRAVAIDGSDRELNRTFVEVKAKLDEDRLEKSGTVLKSVSPLGENRIALVIGNSAYENASPLRNTESDARAVGEKFRDLGFRSVRIADNLKRDTFVAALASFAKEAQNADWAVVYYAGHGMEVGGVNWLVPVDAAVKGGVDMKRQAVSLDDVISAVEKAKKLRLVILDACRDNPFQGSPGNQQGFARGLGRIEPAGATLVAYSAKHGQVALDGDGAHSPFVESLLKHMGTSGLEINRLFRRVADEVVNKTGTQEPFTYGRLPDEDFFFRPPTAVAKN